MVGDKSLEDHRPDFQFGLTNYFLGDWLKSQRGYIPTADSI